MLTARRGPVARTVFDRLSTEANLGLAAYTAEHAYAAQPLALARSSVELPGIEPALKIALN